jgi:two-component system cell cycle sensor histidine kinase/response regulator CckA
MTTIETTGAFPDVWPSLSHEDSPSEAFRSWANLLRQHFDAQEVAIWSSSGESGETALEGYARSAAATGSTLTQHGATKDALRQTEYSRQTLLIVGSEADGRVASYQADTSLEGVMAVVVPILVHNRFLGAVAARFSGAETANDVASLESLAGRIGSGIAFYQRQSKLRQAQRNHQALVQTSPFAVVRLDSRCNVLSWNSAAERIFGWKASDILGQRLPIISAAEGDHLVHCCQSALGGSATKRIETTAVTQSRDTIDIALSASPVFDEQGNVDSALILIESIAARKHAERLVHFQNRVAQILARGSSIDEVVSTVLTLTCSLNGWDCGEYWTIEREGRQSKRQNSAHLCSANAAYFDQEMKSRPQSGADYLVTRVLNAGETLWMPDLSTDRRIDRANLIAQCGLNDALGFRVAFGKDVFGVILFVAESITKPDDRLLACLDVIGEQLGQFLWQKKTEASLRAAEKRLFQSQKLETMGRLVGGVVHDFNNLMTVILGYGELLLDGTVDSDLVHEAHEEILDAGKHAALLTRRLLAFSRKESSELVAVNLNSVIDHLQSMIRRLIGQKVEFCLDLAASLPHVSADPAQIEQTIMNLVVNAHEAMPSGGKLTIRTRSVEIDKAHQQKLRGAAPGPYVLLSVSDTGCGMDEPTQARVFDPFFSTKPSETATGLGLATVCDNMRQTGGYLLLESKPGHGTTFDLYFPAGFTTLTSWVVDSPPPPATNGNETVLIVEDEQRVRRLVGTILRARGYTVLESDDCSDAMELARKHTGSIDLLIADLVLPDVNGIALADRLLKIRPGVPVLWVSGYAGGELICDASDDQNRAFLHKPFTSHELTSMVRQILDDKRTGSEQTSR